LGVTLRSWVAAQTIDDIESALRSHICNYPKIDTTHLPDFRSCKPLEPDWWKVQDCQNRAQHYFDRVVKYNNACHGNDSNNKPLSNESSPRGGRLQAGTGGTGQFRTDRDAGARAAERLDFERANRTDTAAAYSEYLKGHPDGRDADWARKRLQDLGGTSSSNDGAVQSDLARRLAAQQKANANIDEARRRQDQRFDNTVQTTQQNYQRYKAQEDAEREAQGATQSNQQRGASAEKCGPEVVRRCQEACSPFEFNPNSQCGRECAAKFGKCSSGLSDAERACERTCPEGGNGQCQAACYMTFER